MLPMLVIPMSKPQREKVCICGRVTLGNGWASHQRSCVEYKRYRLSYLESAIEKIEAGEWKGKMSPSALSYLLLHFKQEAQALTIELLARD